VKKQLQNATRKIFGEIYADVSKVEDAADSRRPRVKL
jgi:hypothetical protein